MDPSQEDIHPGAGAHSWTATGRERPVFLDEHGRRRRWVLAGGTLAGTLAGLWLAALIAGAIGFTTLPLPHALSFAHHRRHVRLAVADRPQDAPVDPRRLIDITRNAGPRHGRDRA